MKEIFSLGIQRLLRDEPRGTQAKIARELNIDTGWLSGIVRGSKSCPDELKQQIAEQLGSNMEDIYALGRSLSEEESVNSMKVVGNGNITVGGNITDTLNKVHHNVANSSSLVELCELLAGFASPVEIEILKEKYKKRKDDLLK